MAADDRAYPSVWARPRRPERSTLTREQIVTAALELLDAEGIDALSMRKLAAKLGVGATSLYWHVANRDELIELLIDAVYGEIEVPEAGDGVDWRDAFRTYARSTRATALRHPWLVSVFEHLAAAHLGPNVTRLTERMMAVLEPAGFDLAEAEQALSAVSAYVAGVAMAEAGWRNWLARRGQTVEDWAATEKRVADELPEDLERTRQIIALYEATDLEKATDVSFDYGLERLLDGLQTRLG